MDLMEAFAFCGKTKYLRQTNGIHASRELPLLIRVSMNESITTATVITPTGIVFAEFST